jgi:hypothetical protein
VTSPISYQAVRLEPVRNERHAAPARTKHLCKGLLCQREFALIYQVERLKQPAPGVALEMVCIAARTGDCADDVKQAIADKLIALAKTGQRNPDVLCEKVLRDIRGQV